MLMLCLLLYGCGGDDLDEVRRYADEVKARSAAPIEPLPTVKTYDSFSYEATAALRDPFTPSKLSTAASDGANGALRPDLNRAREPLEDYPLDSLRMVGTLARDGQKWSLIQDKEGAVHRVQVGNYMGQNYGKITAITEQGTDLIEIVDDGQGGWIERPASMALSEPTEGGAKK
ncbi:MAG: pilus assembly protein PilP [Gammaproteobacteria bacterium]|nr:pilus assembly protein PilP [Gammaproteobacteria bacterium]